MGPGIDKARSQNRMLGLGALGMLLLLLVQFLAGMFVNLFVAIPSGHPGSSGAALPAAFVGMGWAIGGSGSFALAFHTILGLLLLLGSLALLAIAIRSGQRAMLVVATAIALVGIVGAGLAGIGFLNYFVDRATYSMAIGFTVAVAGYVATLFLLGQSVAVRIETAEPQAAS
jgi:hypothetical protein